MYLKRLIVIRGTLNVTRRTLIAIKENLVVTIVEISLRDYSE